MRWVHTFHCQTWNVALFETVRILRTVKWRDWQGIEAAKHTIEFPAAPFSASFSSKKSKKWIKLIPKTIGNRKRDCAWGCAWGINTTWENLQIEKHKSGRRSFRSPNWFVLFDLQISQVVFIPQAQPHAQSLFLFPIVFAVGAQGSKKSSKCCKWCAARADFLHAGASSTKICIKSVVFLALLFR